MTDKHTAVTSAPEREDRIERAIRRAYDMLTALNADTREDKRWISLAELRAEIDLETKELGVEHYRRDEIDAALRRLTHTTDGPTVHVIAQDAADQLTAADHEAAVTFGGAARHQIHIEHDPARPSGHVQGGQPASYWFSSPDDGDWPGVDQELVARISDMMSAAEFAEYEAERLEDADNSAGARRVRLEAKASLREADRMSREAGLGSIFNDDSEVDLDADEAPELLGESDEQDPYGLAPVRQHLAQLRTECDDARDSVGVAGIDITLREIDTITDKYQQEDAQHGHQDAGDAQELLAERRANLNETLYGFDLNFELDLASRATREPAAADTTEDGDLNDAADDEADELTDDEMRALTAELAVDPQDDVVVAGVVMSPAEATEISEPWFAGDPDELGDDQASDLAENNSAGATDDATAAVDKSACTTAVSRATVSADTARRNVSEATAATADNDRDAELAAWSQADRAVQDHAIEKNDAPVSDISLSW
ncbi:hypothetical protein [Kribbella sindirgiensis]|uniref:Uncharacterized protein n=1 Tax=Kribbella sindirgiensis TaxID=1124744 RepID=A0A4R0IN92_9ACTN|nr:hypothetical protein [Kribbella sindirgiensis]TCC35093.1 hypothetical protein E0H50_14595 [Kribbella sindirgiensis]